MNVDQHPLQGLIVDTPVHMSAEDYHRGGTGAELVPVARPTGLDLAALVQQHSSGGQAPLVVVINQAPPQEAAQRPEGRFGAVAWLGIVAVAIVALVLLAPIIAAMLQTLVVGLVTVAAVAVFLARALRTSTPPPAPAPEKKRRRWGR